MRLFTLTTCIAALLSIHQIIRLPYAGGVFFFTALSVLVYIDYVRDLKLVGYSAFFGLLILSAIMGGYYADVKDVGGTIIPELVMGSVGALLIIFEVLKPSVDP